MGTLIYSCWEGHAMSHESRNSTLVVFGDSLDPGSWTPIHGTAVTDPAYGHDSADPHDLGVIVLDRDAPVAPATLPAAGAAATGSFSWT